MPVTSVLFSNFRLFRFIRYFRWLELILDDVGEDVCQTQSGGAHLLGNEAGSGHAGGCVNFQQVDVVGAVGVLGDDIVDADDAVAVQDVIDA